MRVANYHTASLQINHHMGRDAFLAPAAHAGEPGGVADVDECNPGVRIMLEGGLLRPLDGHKLSADEIKALPPVRSPHAAWDESREERALKGDALAGVVSSGNAPSEMAQMRQELAELRAQLAAQAAPPAVGSKK